MPACSVTTFFPSGKHFQMHSVLVYFFPLMSMKLPAHKHAASIKICVLFFIKCDPISQGDK